MPAVEFGHAEDPIERPTPDLHVGMLTDAVNTRRDDPERENWCGCSKSDEGHDKAQIEQSRVEEMKPQSVQPVETRRAVVCGVNAPKPIPLVFEAVDPVVEEFDDYDCKYQLGKEWPGRRPKCRAK